MIMIRVAKRSVSLSPDLERFLVGCFLFLVAGFWSRLKYPRRVDSSTTYHGRGLVIMICVANRYNLTSAEIYPCCSQGRTVTMRGDRFRSLRSQNQCPLIVSFLYIQIVEIDRTDKWGFFDRLGATMSHAKCLYTKIRNQHTSKITNTIHRFNSVQFK